MPGLIVAMKTCPSISGTAATAIAKCSIQEKNAIPGIQISSPETASSGVTVMTIMKLSFSAALNLPASGSFTRGETAASPIRPSQRRSSRVQVQASFTFATCRAQSRRRRYAENSGRIASARPESRWIQEKTARYGRRGAGL